MDDEDLPEISGWLAAIFTIIAIPGLTLIALQLAAIVVLFGVGKTLAFAGEIVLRTGHRLTRLAYKLNGD